VHDELDRTCCTTEICRIDEIEAREGDRVTIIHSKPFSRRKHYQLHSIQRRIADQEGKMTLSDKVLVEPVMQGRVMEELKKGAATA
jgi:hypothetical protein